MKLPPPPPRRVRLNAFGMVTYGFMIVLVTAMLLGPPISFLVQNGDEQTLLERGVLTRFDLSASRSTHGGKVINYVFEARDATGGAPMRVSRQSTITDDDFATFADPEKSFVLYDPANPENAIPVTSREALAERHAFYRKAAIWFYFAWAAILLLFEAVCILRLRQKLRLLRFGVAARPAKTHYAKSRLAPGVEFQFADTDGKLRARRQFVNFRLGIGWDFAPLDFAPFTEGAVVFYDPDNPRNCELFLPRLAAFEFVER